MSNLPFVGNHRDVDVVDKQGVDGGKVVVAVAAAVAVAVAAGGDIAVLVVDNNIPRQARDLVLVHIPPYWRTSSCC